MHYLIRVITKADNAEQALENTESYMSDLVEQGEYDWYNMDGRWGKSEAFKLSSDEGQEMVDEGMRFTRDNFNRSMAAIRHMVENYTDEQIFEEQWDENDAAKTEHYLSRYQFDCAYGYGSGNAFVYGDSEVWGSSIKNHKDLQHVLNDSESADFWVVPVDVHN